MPSEIQIGSLSGDFSRGATLRVPVVVVLDRATKVRGIRAAFSGFTETKADYTTTSTDSNGDTQTHHHTAVQAVPFISQDYLLAGGEALGFFGAMADGVASLFGGGKHETLPAGEHPFEIEFTIPPDAPPTHVGRKSRVAYELSVVVDIPMARDLTVVHGFDLPAVAADVAAAPIRTRYPDDNGRGLIDSMFGVDVEVEVALSADTFRRGEPIEGIVAAEVRKPVKCRRVTARLMAMEASEAHGHTDRFTHQEPLVEIAQPGEIADSFSQRFSLPAEIAGPPSARGERFSIDWFLEVQFDVPWASDPTIRVPIQILPA